MRIATHFIIMLAASGAGGIVLAGFGAYLTMLSAIFVWSRLRVVRPLDRPDASAADSMKSGRPLSEPPAGPEELRSRTTTVEELVTLTPAPRPPTVLRGSETILLVEDEPSLLRLVRAMLERRGYTIIEASDGREALRVADAHDGEIDLVISDVVMPLLSGPEMELKLRERRPDVKFIFVSGYPQHRLTSVTESGPTRFLQKPFTVAQLRSEVSRALSV